MWLKAALGYLAGAAVKDAVVRPRTLGKLARAYCDRVGKPLLFIHDNGVVHHALGPPVRSEFETARLYPLPYETGQMGAIFAVGVLECARYPAVAMQEWRRVADQVFVVIPSWWSPMAWLPMNRWFIDPNMDRAIPLWSSEKRVHLLQLSDKRYGAGQWKKKLSPNPQPPEIPADSPLSNQENQSTESLSSASTLMVISSPKSGGS